MVGTNDGGKIGLDPVYNDFCYKLISGVAESYGSEVPERYNIFAFGDEANKGRIIFLRYGGFGKSFPTEVYSLGTNNVPELLKKEEVQVIEAWSLKGFKRLEGNQDFNVPEGGVKSISCFPCKDVGVVLRNEMTIGDRGMTGSVETAIVVDDVILDVILFRDDISHIVFELNNSIPSSLINGGKMKECSVGIPLIKPRDSGLCSPEVFFTLEGTIIIIEELILQFVE